MSSGFVISQVWISKGERSWQVSWNCREEPPNGRISQAGKAFLMVESNGGKFFIMHLCLHANSDNSQAWCVLTVRVSWWIHPWGTVLWSQAVKKGRDFTAMTYNRNEKEGNGNRGQGRHSQVCSRRGGLTWPMRPVCAAHQPVWVLPFLVGVTTEMDLEGKTRQWTGNKVLSDEHSKSRWALISSVGFGDELPYNSVLIMAIEEMIHKSGQLSVVLLAAVLA